MICVGLEWRVNAVGDLIAPVEDRMFFRIGDAGDLWLIRRVDHQLGGFRRHLGWFATAVEAQDAAEKYEAKGIR